jgi:hypothetical protein
LRDGAVRLAFEYGKIDFNVIKVGDSSGKRTIRNSTANCAKAGRANCPSRSARSK